MMNRNLRPNRSTQHIKEGINFSFEDVEKKLDKCKRAIEFKGKQLFDIKNFTGC